MYSQRDRTTDFTTNHPPVRWLKHVLDFSSIRKTLLMKGRGGSNGDSHWVKDLGFCLELKPRIPKEAYSVKYCNWTTCHISVVFSIWTLTTHPLVSISSAGLWAISSSEKKVLLIHAHSLQVECLQVWAAGGVQGQYFTSLKPDVLNHWRLENKHPEI